MSAAEEKKHCNLDMQISGKNTHAECENDKNKEEKIEKVAIVYGSNESEQENTNESAISVVPGNEKVTENKNIEREIPIPDLESESAVTIENPDVGNLIQASLSESELAEKSEVKDDSLTSVASNGHAASGEHFLEDDKSTSNVTDSYVVESDKSTLNSSDLVIVDEYQKPVDDESRENKLLEESTNSDVVQIIEESLEKDLTDDKLLTDSLQLINANQESLTSLNSNQDQDSPVLINDSDVEKHSLKKLTAEDGDKFLSSVCSDHIGFDSQPAYSTPNEIKDSTESLVSLPPLKKKLFISADISALVYMNKESWTGELTNIICDQMVHDLSGNLADVSKSNSPSSSASANPYPLKGNRFSVASSSSSSSLASASTLARKLHDNKLLNLNKKDIKLTKDRIKELRDKWLNSDEIYKILDFVDRVIITTDNITNDDSLKAKEVIKEPLAIIDEVISPVSTNKSRQTRGKRQAKVKFSTDAEVEVPRKRQRRVDSLEMINLASNFSEGDSVFAKWSDRKFYAANLGELSHDGKWQVNFFDGDKKSLLEEFLIKADAKMMGHNVYASQGDDNFTQGIITEWHLKDGVLQYTVARDKGDISVPCQFIYLTESQARQIRTKTTAANRTPAKNENLILPSGNKRSTRSKTRLLLDSPKPSVSGTQVACLSDSDDYENEDNTELNLEDVAGVEPESHGVYENGIKLKGKALTGKMRFARTNKMIDADASVLGPVPDDGSKYFKNLHVLLTCTRPQSPKLQALDDTSTNTSGNGTSSESENFHFSTIPFVKDRLKLQLQMGGANVYSSFDDIPQKFWKNTYLISNRPNNSAKYIQCLAAGIKIICHEWIVRCCTDKKKVALQELPLGWSLERKRYFNFYDRKSTTALKKISLLIVDTGDKNFYKFWSKICKLADITVAKLTRDSNLEQITAIISESGYRDEHVERAISHNITLVTTTWLIQSLMHGEPRHFDGHKTYTPEYVDSD